MSDDDLRAVLASLIGRYPYSLMAAEVREECNLPTAQRAGGLLRHLRDMGLAEGRYSANGYLQHWWATQAAVEAHRLWVTSRQEANA